MQEARGVGRAVASRRACTARTWRTGGASASRASSSPGARASGDRRPTPIDPRVKQLEVGEPPTAAEARAGGDDHHPPKKSCRDPGDPPETPRHRRDRLMVAIDSRDHDRRDRGALSERRPRARDALSASTARPAVDAGRPRAPSSRALVPAERQAVLDVLHSERFVDQSPAEVQATLLEEQTYLCSTRTMYRILDAAAGSPGAARPGAASGVRETGARGDGARIRSGRGTSRS